MMAKVFELIKDGKEHEASEAFWVAAASMTDEDVCTSMVDMAKALDRG